MHYGLNFANGGPFGDAQTLGELARLAEDSGWDGVFLEDYLIWQGHQDVPTCDPWIALAAMALNTNHIRLGTMVTALARRRPWKVARETVTLDHLSNGRLILGVGLGDTSVFIKDPSFLAFEEARSTQQRAKMLDEALDILVGLWSGQPFGYAGEYYHVDQVTFLPRPIQTPRIPIWIGGGWPLKGPTRRAARWDGSCLYRHPGSGSHQFTVSNVRILKADIERERTSSSKFDIALGGGQRGADLEKERASIKSFAEAGATWWVEYVPPMHPEAARQAVRRGPLRID
ncbi:MAG: LLM class flavin-dependent oxidoreductase [Acidobacteriota bacterium]